jgi:hypothetical protein
MFNDAEFDFKLLKAIERELGSAVRRNIGEFEDELKKIIKAKIDDSPTIKSMYSGSLRGHFGFIAGEEPEYVDPIINAIVSSLKVTNKGMLINRYRAQNLDITIVDVDFDHLTKIGRSEYTSTTHGQSHQVKWLEWLLNNGTTIVVSNYRIVFGNHPGSRSGMAVMSKKEGKGYRVPPEHSGTQDNNFITRIFDDILEKQISDLIETILFKGIS